MDAQPLPDLYAPWIAALLPTPLAGEPRATCSECAMCVLPDGNAQPAAYLFRPDVKCCAYVPRLPNFLVGRVLREVPADAVAAEGRRSVEARVAARVGVTPLGLDRPPAYDLHHRHAVNAFGNSRALRCPHFVEEGGGLCGIWRHREGVCATWFCKFERGRAGFERWQALRELLAEVERDLALSCALEVGVDPEALVGLLSAAEAASPHRPWQELEGVPDPATYAKLWGAWAGRERALYEACAERVDGLTWDQVLARCGPRVAARASAFRAAHARVGDDRLPARLRAGSFQVLGPRSDGLGVRVVTYSAFDAIDLPARLLPLLPAFDGRPTDEVLEEVSRVHGAELDPAFLRRLIDWGVLIALE